MKTLPPARQLRHIVLVLIGLLLLSTALVKAHTQSTSYMTLRATASDLTGEWHLALRDLEDAVGLDVNDDGVITWSELSARKEAVSAYALSRLQIRGDDVPTMRAWLRACRAG